MTPPRSQPATAAPAGLVAETLTAGLANGPQLFFGTPVNVGRLISRAADELGITIHVVTT